MAAARFEMAISILYVLLIIGIVLFAALVIVIVLLVRRANRQASAPSSEPPKHPLCEILREHRTHSGMTQEYVAEALGVSRQAVSKWEAGASVPTAANLSALAELYGITTEELMASK